MTSPVVAPGVAVTAAGATVGEAVTVAAARLAAAGIPEPRREARLLVAAALGVEPGIVLGWPERGCDAAALRRVEALVRRRAAREPVSRIFGRREFWSLSFALSPATLDPRADSETLVEAALALVPEKRAPLRLLDLGTGTGCLLLALLAELPNAFGIGVDVAPEAATTARRNAVALGLGERARFVVGDWAAAIGGRFDLVLANPPYIPSAEIATLEPEVAEHDPRRALDGGPDGLAAYRALAGTLERLLAPEGRAVVEIGSSQGDDVAAIMATAGIALVERRHDLSGQERCLVLATNAKKWWN